MPRPGQPRLPPANRRNIHNCTPAALGRPQILQTALFKPLEAQVREELLKMDVEGLTPLEALNKLEDIKRKLLGETDT